MQVTYWYNIPVPSRQAAMIQQMNTGRALSDLGVDVRIVTGANKKANATELLEFWGLTPHERFEIEPSERPRPKDVLRNPLHSEPHVIIVRGELGLSLLEGIGRLPAKTYVLWEAHRTCYLLPDEHPELSEEEREKRSNDLRDREERALRMADGLVCVSQGVHRALDEAFGVDMPSLILPGGVCLHDTAHCEDDQREIDVLYAGKLMRRKGVNVLIEAMRFLPGRRLLLVGGSSKDIHAYRVFAERHGVVAQVTFEGFVPPGQMSRYYERAKVGTCPLPSGASIISDRFTCPLKLLDMMACGVPVVATDKETIRAIVCDGETALLVKPNSAEALASGIQRLLDDRTLARRLATNARKAVGHYAWENRAKRLLEFMQEVTTQPARASLTKQRRWFGW